MAGRNEKPIFDGKRYRGPERRQQKYRRKSDIVVALLKYIVVGLFAAALAKYLL